MSASSLPIALDIGMCDAADTIYYLESGYRVIAVEAHPGYARQASMALPNYISTGQLTILNLAVARTPGPVKLVIDGFNPGGHSVVESMVKSSVGSIPVEGCTMADVLSRVPGRIKLLKIDIEGADELCLSALTRENRPEFLSVEMHEGLARHMSHLTAIGFDRFKLIDQTSFSELSQKRVLEHFALKFLRRVGFAEPKAVRRDGRWFKLGFSSGPVPWKTGGAWSPADKVIRQYEHFVATNRRNVWLDLHAC